MQPEASGRRTLPRYKLGIGTMPERGTRRPSVVGWAPSGERLISGRSLPAARRGTRDVGLSGWRLGRLVRQTCCLRGTTSAAILVAAGRNVREVSE